MGFGIGLGIGFGSQRAAAGVALAISDLVIDTVSSPNRITLAATKAGTVYWVVTASATTPSAAQIIAGQTHTGATASLADSFAVVLGETVDNPDFTTLAAGTWYLHCAMTSGSETSNTLTSASFTIAASFTAAWQQFSGTAWLERNSDVTGVPTNSAGLTAAMTYSPSAGDIGVQVNLLTTLQTVNRFIDIVKLSTNNVRARTENSSDALTYSLTGSGTAMSSGGKYLVLYAVDPTTKADLKIIDLATGTVIATATVSAAATLGGPSSTGTVIGAASGAGASAISGQMERVMVWENTYADITDGTVQGYFHASGVLQAPSAAVAAIGTPHIQIVGADLQTGTNAGSGGAFVKDGAGSIVAA